MNIKTSLGRVIDLPRVSMADRENVLKLRTVERLLMEASDANDSEDTAKFLSLESKAFEAADAIVSSLLGKHLEDIGPSDLFIICSALKNGETSVPEHMLPDQPPENLNPTPAGSEDQG